MDDFSNNNDAVGQLQTELEKLRSGADTVQEFAISALRALEAFEALRTQNELTLGKLQESGDQLSNTASSLKSDSAQILESVQRASDEFSGMVRHFEGNEVVSDLREVHRLFSTFDTERAALLQQIEGFNSIVGGLVKQIEGSNVLGLPSQLVTVLEQVEVVNKNVKEAHARGSQIQKAIENGFAKTHVTQTNEPGAIDAVGQKPNAERPSTSEISTQNGSNE